MSSGPSRATFTFIFITVALDLLALGLIVPVLPNLIAQLEGGDLAKAASITGVFGFAWAAAQFVASTILGMLSDRFGRRPVILLSCLGLGLQYVIMAIAPSVAVLFVGRILSGVTAATYPTAGAYIADVTPVDQRAAKFGMLGAAFGLGFIIGPAVGGALGAIDLRLPFWVAAVLCVANVAYGAFVLPESLPKEKRASSFEWSRANPIGAIRLFASTPLLWGLGVAAFLQAIAQESLPATFVLSAKARFDWPEAQVGFALAAMGVMSTIVSAALVGPLTKRTGERAAMLVGFAFGIVGLGLFGAAPVGWGLIVAIVVEAPWGIAGPAMQSLMSREASADQQGHLQGAMGSLRGIAGMIGPLLFTQALARSLRHEPGFDALGGGSPFLIACALLTACTVVATTTTRTRSR